MTQDHSSKLSFSIEESVWLNKGQEVDEIVSLSLDPEITVQEHGDYVLIRGGLKLTGEYRSSGNSIASEGDKESLSSQVAFRSIEEVTINEDGTGEIKHHFPIDVTIPQERIKSLDDIYVIVDSFDYDIPERGCIQLTADVSITGMSTQRVNNEAIDRFNSEESADERTFHFEAYNEEHTEEEDETVVQFPTIDETNQFEEEQQNRSEEVEVELELSDEEVDEVDEVEEVELVSEVDEVEEVEEVSKKEVQSPAIAFGVVKHRPKNKSSVEVKETAEVDELLQTKEETFSIAKSFSKQRKLENKQQQKNSRNEIEADEVEEIVDEEKPPREENALYLTKMLTKGEEEQFKKLKLCIIRENETLETIAARYEINQSTLIKVNQLNDTNVEEGQILYIPVTQ